MACLFLICLTAVCALDVTSSLRIVKMERATSEADSYKFTFTVHYDQAEQKPEVEWTVTNNTETPQDTILQGAMTYSSEDKSGMASVDLYKAVEIAKIRLGRLGSHHLLFYLNLVGDATFTHDVNFALSTITPGTDLAYKASDGQTTVTVVTPQPSSDSQLTRANKEMDLFGNLLDKDTRQIITAEKKAIRTEDAQGTVTNTFTFATDVNVINGFYTGQVLYTIDTLDSPIIYGILEQIFLLVHEDSNQGPFPDDFLKVEINGKNEMHSKGCREESACYLDCAAYGNDIQSLKIYQRAGRKEVDLEAAVDQEVGSYRWSASVNVTGSPSGVYVCRVKQGDLVSTDIVQLIQLDKEAWVDSLTYELINSQEVKLTCKGSGGQPLGVTLNWAEARKEFVPEESGVVSYTPGQAGGDGLGDAVATAILARAVLPRATIECRASNPASYGYSRLYTASLLAKGPDDLLTTS